MPGDPAGAFDIMGMQVGATASWYPALWHQWAYQYDTEQICREVTASAAQLSLCLYSIASTLLLEAQVKPLPLCERLQKHRVTPTSWA